MLRRCLAKAEGSRGGHIIGHTRTGHPIYQSHKGDSADYHHFSPQDHASAAYLHDKAADEATSTRDIAHHTQMAASHRVVYERVRDKQNAKLPPGQRGAQRGNAHPPDNPKPEDGHEVGKIFTGRAVYANRQPHHYEEMTAAEHGDASRVHGVAAEKAKAAGDHEKAAIHGAMRHAHVQATMSQAKIEAKLRGQDRPYGRDRSSGRSAYA